MTTALIKKKFPEIFLSLELVMLGYDGIGGLSQSVLHPTTRPAPPVCAISTNIGSDSMQIQVAKHTVDFAATAAEFEKAVQEDITFADVSFDIPADILGSDHTMQDDVSIFFRYMPVVVD